MPASDLPGASRQADPASLFEPPPELPAPVALAWCSLDQRALLRVDGADAESFLQGQLTQDMARLAQDRVLYAAHCTPKGRITALFVAWRQGNGILLELPAELGAAARRRLSMYVLRAKVGVHDAAAEWWRTALAGNAAAALLDAAGIARPAEVGQLARSGALDCLRLGDARWVVVSPAGQDGGLRERLAATSAADAAGWQLHCLRDGAPEVLATTSEVFVPQMLNLDRLDGISFRKGCYTGQEIVARAHYLGRVKRRMRRFGWSGTRTPEPGSQLALAGAAAGTPAAADGESAGQAQVVWALATGPHGGEALAVAVGMDDAAEPAPPASATDPAQP